MKIYLVFRNVKNNLRKGNYDSQKNWHYYAYGLMIASGSDLPIIEERTFSQNCLILHKGDNLREESLISENAKEWFNFQKDKNYLFLKVLDNFSPSDPVKLYVEMLKKYGLSTIDKIFLNCYQIFGLSYKYLIYNEICLPPVISAKDVIIDYINFIVPIKGSNVQFMRIIENTSDHALRFAIRPLINYSASYKYDANKGYIEKFTEAEIEKETRRSINVHIS